MEQPAHTRMEVIRFLGSIRRSISPESIKVKVNSGMFIVVHMYVVSIVIKGPGTSGLKCLATRVVMQGVAVNNPDPV